ncbi:MAG: Vms1/Ankzf1 family peptidyl-tRNA hydrolase [Haloferacaceae archaeon]
MLDELLGRAELKDRIAELEAEKERLSEQLEAESERRAEAVSDRQAAEERVNRLEDRVAELGDRVERAGGDGDPDFRRVEELHDGRRDEVLARLRSVETGPEGALTAMVGDDPPDAVREAFGARAPLLARAAPCLALTDDAGLVSVALVPPFPPDPFSEWGTGFRLDGAWFTPPDRVALALVRADLFALGVYEDGDRVETETFTTEVEEGHSKGGFSQGRFERRRDEQVADHLDRVRRTLRERDEPLVLAGDRDSLTGLDVDAIRRVTVDASGEPTEALERARRDAFATRLYVL